MKKIGVGGFKFSALEKKYLSDVIASNQLSYGKFSETFESEFARLHECKHAVFVNSGTSALHIALAALKEHYDWNDGDEVIVPAVTFVATANIVLHNKMTPVFVDVDRYSYNIDHEKIEAAITKKTRAIIPVHLTGLPANMIQICDIAYRHKLKIIEDSCETMFATINGKSVGSFGDISCFSTYMAHFIVTGVGGLALTNDEALAIRLRSLANHGRDAIYYRCDGDLNSQVMESRFRFVSVGHSFRATEFEAAVGLAQLKNYKKIIAARKKNAFELYYGLRGLERDLQLPEMGGGRTYMMFPLVARKHHLWEITQFLEDNGIETRPLLPIINQPIYRDSLDGKRLPVAEWLNNNAFYIGCHQYLTQKDIQFCVKKIHEFVKGKK